MDLRLYLFCLSFYLLSYLLSKTMGCLSGCLVSSASVHKLFCGICSAFKWSFDEFVGGKSGLPVLFLHHLKTAPPPPTSLGIFMVGAAEVGREQFSCILPAGRADEEITVFPGCLKVSYPDHGEKGAGNIWQLYKLENFKFFSLKASMYVPLEKHRDCTVRFKNHFRK